MKTLKQKVIKGMMVCLILLVAAWAIAELILDVEIEVAPHVLNLQNQGEVVTVHTNLNYGDVSSVSVSLNGVPIFYSKVDNCGNFVAKFHIEDIKGLPLDIGQYNTMTLEGYTVDGVPFEGSADIKVIDKSGK